MGYNMKRGAAPKFKNLGSSKDGSPTNASPSKFFGAIPRMLGLGAQKRYGGFLGGGLGRMLMGGGRDRGMDRRMRRWDADRERISGAIDDPVAGPGAE